MTSDIELKPLATSHLSSTITSLSWTGVSVTVKDRETKQHRAIVDNAEGVVHAGEMCALMGPSGCGKTTLLNVLARRPTNAADVSAEILVNGRRLSSAAFRRAACFVEQEDALMGSLTVRETMDFSLRLASTMNRRERIRRIEALVAAFGLTEQRDSLVGTPIRKGISGGQKRRLGVASQLITGPGILFLDEPTSGLDSAASREVLGYLRDVAREHGLVVLCSIHQPSTATFNLFDKLMLMSGGRTYYSGPVSGVVRHFEELGMPVPGYVNPAEFLLDQVNVDFAGDRESAQARLEGVRGQWLASRQAREARAAVGAVANPTRMERGWRCDSCAEGVQPFATKVCPRCQHVLCPNCPTEEVQVAVDSEDPTPSTSDTPGFFATTLTLLHRSFTKSYRDVVAYGIRLAMYTGLAIMMGTVWVRLDATQTSIQPFINAIFFGSAFMSFMAVAYVPAFLEDRAQYVKERRNGLCGPLELIVSNFLIGVPYLFGISMVFSTISYWLSNFQPTATAFFTWVLWLFLDLLAAESLVVFFTSLVPNFVVSLALVAFANGLWMSVGGFMVPPTILNPFYKYVFHYWDYQKYVFQGMMVNEFADRTYSCGADCRCMYDSPLANECRIDGQAVLDQYGYSTGDMAQNLGIMVAIILGYRIAGWVVLKLRV